MSQRRACFSGWENPPPDVVCFDDVSKGPGTESGSGSSSKWIRTARSVPFRSHAKPCHRSDLRNLWKASSPADSHGFIIIRVPCAEQEGACAFVHCTCLRAAMFCSHSAPAQVHLLHTSIPIAERTSATVRAKCSDLSPLSN